LLTSLEGLGVREDLKVLYLQNNYLISFKYLKQQPSLEILVVSNNCIASFYGMEFQPKLQHVVLEGNPIAKHPHYRVMCLMCAGIHIKKIDNQMVSFKEREFVRNFVLANPSSVDAIRSGWLLDLKVRSEDEFRKLIQDLQKINMDDRDLVKNTLFYKQLVSGSLQIVEEPIPEPVHIITSAAAVDRRSPIKSRVVTRDTQLLNNGNNNMHPNNMYQQQYQQQQPQLQQIFVTEQKQHFELSQSHQTEIKNLRAEVARLQQEMKRERDNLIGIEELLLFSKIEIGGFMLRINMSDEGESEPTLMQVSTDAINFLEPGNLRTVKTVYFNRVTRVSFN